MTTPKTWALLGATGANGSEILRSLLRNPPADVELSVLVESRTRLLDIFPLLVKECLAVDLPIRIIEGDVADSAALEECLADAQVIVACNEENTRRRGTTPYSNTADAVIKTLRRLRYQQHTEFKHYQTPTIVQLRPASQNPAPAGQFPKAVHKLARFYLRHSHRDLKKAGSMYQTAGSEAETDETPLLHYELADSLTLHGEDRRVRAGYQLPSYQSQQMPLSCSDMGQATTETVECAGQPRGQMRSVSVTRRAVETRSVRSRHPASGALGRARDGIMRCRTHVLGGICSLALGPGSQKGSMPLR